MTSFMAAIAAHILQTPQPGQEDWASLMQAFCDPQTADEDKAAALDALAAREMDGDMLAACAEYLLAQALPLDIDVRAIDVCGTGGDKSRSGVKTFNISTASAFVIAAAGQGVIKHGNRAVSSQAGSSDVLSALGLPAAESAEAARRSFDRHGLCFVSAPAFHPALKYAAAARRAYGKPSFFNLLGPLCNPARVQRQVMGVFDSRYLQPVAEAARRLGKTDMMVLHSDDGLDEISLAAPTQVARLKDGILTKDVFSPEQAGVHPRDLSALAGGDADMNARIIRAIFKAPEGAGADIIALNAGAALWLAGKAESLMEGCQLAQETLKNGKAAGLLDAMSQDVKTPDAKTKDTDAA